MPSTESEDYKIDLKLVEDNFNQRLLENYVRINGVKETPNEDLHEVVASLGKSINVDINNPDISMVYRSGKKAGSPRPRPIVIKFNNVTKKIDLLSKKKHLNKSTDYKKCFIQSELTFLRWKLFYYLKGSDLIESLFVRNGSVVAKKKSDQSLVSLRSIRDLKSLGIDCGPQDLEALGLKTLSNN